MSSWQFNTLFGGFQDAPEGIAAHSDSPLTDAHNYACNEAGSEGGPVRKPPTATGFCAGATLSAPLTGMFGDLDIFGNVSYWPNFVTAQGPTINDVRPAPDWISVAVAFPNYAYLAYEGDPDSGLDVCRLPTGPGQPYRCGPIVLKTPQVTFDIDRQFRTYAGWSNRYAEDGTYQDGPVIETDPTVVETNDAPVWPGVFGETDAYAADVVPPDPYIHAWVPGPSEPFFHNANKLWKADDILSSTYSLTMPGGSWSGVTYTGAGLIIDVTLYWESSGDDGDTGSGLLMLVV